MSDKHLKVIKWIDERDRDKGFSVAACCTHLKIHRETVTLIFRRLTFLGLLRRHARAFEHRNWLHKEWESYEDAVEAYETYLVCLRCNSARN